MTETLSYGYSSESTQQELSNEYQHDRVWTIFKNLCILVFWTKVALALEGLTLILLVAKVENGSYDIALETCSTIVIGWNRVQYCVILYLNLFAAGG